MKNRTRLIALVVGVILLSGVIVTLLTRFAFGYFPGGGSRFFGGGSVQRVDVSTEHTETLPFDSFHSLHVDVDNADVTLEPSDRYELEYHYFGDLYRLSYALEGGTLRVQDKYMLRPTRNFFGIDNGYISYNGQEVPRNTVTVRYPQAAALQSAQVLNDYGDLRCDGIEAAGFAVEMENGRVELKNIRAQRAEITNDYGSAELNNAALSDAGMQSLTVEMENGDLTLRGVTAQEMKLRNDYGAVEMEQCGAGELQVEMENGDLSLLDVSADGADFMNDYGRIEGERVSLGSLTALASNGDVRLSGALHGQTDIRNDYGDVRLRPQGGRSAYGMELKTEYGTIRVDGQEIDGDSDEDDIHFTENEGAENLLRVQCENGGIEISFPED